MGSLAVMFTSLFMNVAAPSGGASGAALFVNDVARRGQSAARAAAGTLLVLIVNLVAFSLVLAVGMAYLFVQQVSGGSRLTDILAGLALLYLSQGLWRHKRVAWLLTLLVLLDSIANHLIKGQGYERAVLAGGLVAWLIYLRRHFQIRLSHSSTQAERESHRWFWFLRWPMG